MPEFEADSVLTKAGLIGLLTLLLLWPLGQVSSLVTEREAVRDQARETIAARVGERQWIAGPVLRIPVQRRRVIVATTADHRPPRRPPLPSLPRLPRLPPHAPPPPPHASAPASTAPASTVWEDAEPVYLRSADLEVRGVLKTQQLRKGLHQIPTYEVTLVLGGRFGAADAASRSIDPAEERLLWQAARVVVPLSALESIRRIERFALDGQALETVGTASPGRVRSPGARPSTRCNGGASCRSRSAWSCRAAKR